MASDQVITTLPQSAFPVFSQDGGRVYTVKRVAEDSLPLEEIWSYALGDHQWSVVLSSPGVKWYPQQLPGDSLIYYIKVSGKEKKTDIWEYSRQRGERRVTCFKDILRVESFHLTDKYLFCLVDDRRALFPDVIQRLISIERE